MSAKNDLLQRGTRFLSLSATPALLVACFLLGGSSRADQPAQMVIRVIAILFIAAALLYAKPATLREVRAPLLFLTGLLVIMLAQLVPLPPVIWRSLAGQAVAVRGIELVGLQDAWRPLSLIPFLTVNSALATLPGFALLLLLGHAPPGQYRRLVSFFAILALLSGVLGLVQISSGQFYMYGSANRGGAVGFFANRNHQAAMLACLIPTMAVLAVHGASRVPIGLRLTIATALTLFVMPLIFITGSRTGLLLLLVACVGAFLLIRYAKISLRDTYRRLPASQRTTARAIVIAAVVALIIMVIMLIVSGRAVAINRVFEQDVEADSRLRLFTTMTNMVREYFPFGAGFGTFATIFKIDEPTWFLKPSYFNHAHNDVLEVMIEGGVLSVGLLLVFALWWSITTIRLWRAGMSRDVMLSLGRLGSVQTLILVLASVVDYPLRTPLGQVLFLLAVAMMARASTHLRGGPQATVAPAVARTTRGS